MVQSQPRQKIGDKLMMSQGRRRRQRRRQSVPAQSRSRSLATHPFGSIKMRRPQRKRRQKEEILWAEKVKGKGSKAFQHFVEVAYACHSPLSPIRSLPHSLSLYKLSPETANRERISHIMGFVSGSSGTGSYATHCLFAYTRMRG